MTTANKLTILRVLMIPVFLVVLYWGFPGCRYVALGIYIVACLTDLLDGYIARHYDQISDFGKFMDPLADKCLVMAALCWFVEEGTFAAWVLAVVLLIVARSGKKRAQQAAAALGELLRSYGAQDADGIYYQAEVHRAAYRACAAAMQAEQKAAAALEDAREHQCETHERLLQSLDFESGTGEAAALYQRKCALELSLIHI